jgi:hypothetical protein
LQNDYVTALIKARTKLIEQRRAMVKRDISNDRNEGYAERIVAIQAGIDATERAIEHERVLAVQASQAA